MHFAMLRRMQLLIWVIEPRHHPRFRAGWEEWAPDPAWDVPRLPVEGAADA